MIIKRSLNLPTLLAQKSFFLFGPRATGKSFLIREQFKQNALIIDLLRSETFLRLSAAPYELEQLIDAHKDPIKVIVIDEIQLIPMLLNEVHRLIEEKRYHFLLTGSSARSLKQKHVNLLAGRAWEANLFPLTSKEIINFNLKKYLQFGGLPPVYLSKAPQEELYAYTKTYLQEEIQAESLVRKIPAFSKFLQTAAITSGQLLNFAAVSSDTAIPASTIREYYQILEDTFIGFMIPAWHKATKRKAKSTAKFYFFDLGVKNTLAGITSIPEKSDLFGNAFEHFIALELRAYIHYHRLHQTLCYWQTKHGHEVDFIIGDKIAIEVKATRKVNDKHLKGLMLLAEENICEQYFLVSNDPIARKVNNIMVMPWQEFLNQLWNLEF